MPKTQKSKALYSHPFSKAYWRDAASELKDTKMLVFAALMIALRLVMKLIYIPLAPGLQINTAFIANALGAMVFGPVMAALCAVITDVLGYLMNPAGVYFIPYILPEVAGSVIFALLLYRVKVTPARVMLSRFLICFLVNVVLQTPISIWYYSLFMGGKTYVLTIPHILKNLFMFPIESVVLSLFLRIMIPITNRVGLTYGGDDAKQSLRFSKRQIAFLVVLFVIGTGCVTAYLGYYYETTSISAAYTTTQRYTANSTVNDHVIEQTDDWDGALTVSIVESAYKDIRGGSTTYNASVYVVDEAVLAENAAAAREKDPDSTYSLTTVRAYSKTPASKDTALTKVATVTLVLDNKTGALLSFAITPVEEDPAA